ncbi:MAG: energy-coupling factor transporter transmembrane protein EcfT [Actinobacteria bacterium]|nr:energy-coupling factor transporter transmembrane protein EcfT [Actinomycetota bacterium]
MTVHQGAWLTWAAAAAISAISTTNPFYLLLLCAIAWVVHAAHWIPGPSSRSFKIFVFFAIAAIAIRTALVALTPLVPDAAPVTSGTFVAAFVEGLRLGTLLVVFGAFNSVSQPGAILNLAPRRFHEAGLAASLALSIAPRTIETVGRVREAQRLRGIKVSSLRTLPALAVPVLETGMDDAVALAESMDARGHGRGVRSRYRPARWNAASAAITAAAVVTAIAFGAAFFGDATTLSMPSFPIRWPQVSVVLVTCELALAVPALVPRAHR